MLVKPIHHLPLDYIELAVECGNFKHEVEDILARDMPVTTLLDKCFFHLGDCRSLIDLGVLRVKLN